MNSKRNILITGATGNVGLEVIKSLEKTPHELSVFLGVRDLVKDSQKLEKFEGQPIDFDFENTSTYKSFAKVDILFLLRPPQLADTEKYFKPLINSAKAQGVSHIIFLSVQGVEKSSIIPHHKIEKLIKESGINYTFLRPAYFMQNFTTTLHQDIKQREIFLPAGDAKFTLIDVRDIGKVVAKIITEIKSHVNVAYDLTCEERLNFQEMADKLSKGLNEKVSFKSPNLLNFVLQKRKEKVKFEYILVLIMLHYFPRFHSPPPISNAVEKITGKKSTGFNQFVYDYQDELLEP